MLCWTLFTNVTLPYNVHVSHYVLECLYIVRLQYNFTISDHSKPVVAHGVMADQLSRFERYRLGVFYRSRNTCCLSSHRRTQAEFRLPTSRFTTSPDRSSWESIAYWRCFLEASVVPSLHRLRSLRKCGILSLCIPKELN